MRLSILQYGDPVLRVKGKRIDQIDDRIRELAANMLETMHAANGIGLAAQQIGEPLQLTVIDIAHAGRSNVEGFIPTGWYPSALAMSRDSKTLYVGIAKGLGSRAGACRRGP